ncbi:MAG TPA: hypothetical protein VFD92_27550 [Candidatus Binatia bacterium]|nr:hypothetical protein [Candidatus Binatia bacterium]
MAAAGSDGAIASSSSAAAPDAAASSARAPDDEERAAMLEILKAETAPERTAWFAVAPGNQETQALASSLRSIFESAGWKVQMQTLTGMNLKPGVSMLSAEEQPPAWAETALRALQASGIDVKSAVGYRAYYEEKKRDDPKWAGIPLAADQQFVIAIGPEPKA